MEGDTPSLVSIKIFKGFLSTPSGWRATKTCHICIRIDQISIHALRVEGDFCTSTCTGDTVISIHALRVEGDNNSGDMREYRYISIHALRVEGDCVRASLLMFIVISIHALRVEGDPRR